MYLFHDENPKTHEIGVFNGEIVYEYDAVMQYKYVQPQHNFYFCPQTSIVLTKEQMNEFDIERWEEYVNA